ncbi:MAG: hypothetical protein KR126chlam3_00523 [Chlamydiae bacterium]|nr:hypothetical protein [Chlamydiota bacterium]
MLSVAASRGDWLDSACPTWFAPVPEKNAKTGSGDWRLVTMIKRDENGDVIGHPTAFQYHLEDSTGDLYGVQEDKKGIDKPFVIAAKALGMFFYTPFYTLGMMTANCIRVAIDMTAIFWRIIPLFVQDIYRKGFFPSLGNATMSIVWDTPIEIAKDIWRIARSPIYGTGMMMASLFTFALPLEGRKWLGKIEYEWHEGVSYQMDIRHRKSQKQNEDLKFSEFISEIAKGKILYLGYCMQKRGNIHEIVAGNPRFEIFEDYQKK